MGSITIKVPQRPMEVHRLLRERLITFSRLAGRPALRRYLCSWRGIPPVCRAPAL